MLEGDQGIEGNGDGKKAPTKPETVQHAQSPTLRAPGWCKCKTKMDHIHGNGRRQGG